MHINYANIYSQGHSHSYLFKSLLLTITQKCAKKCAKKCGSCRGDPVLLSGNTHWTQKLQETTNTNVYYLHRTDTEEIVRWTGVAQVFCTHLSCHLPNTVNELQEDWWAICVCVILITMAHSLYTQNIIMFKSTFLTIWKKSPMFTKATFILFKHITNL